MLDIFSINQKEQNEREVTIEERIHQDLQSQAKAKQDFLRYRRKQSQGKRILPRRASEYNARVVIAEKRIRSTSIGDMGHRPIKITTRTEDTGNRNFHNTEDKAVDNPIESEEEQIESWSGSQDDELNTEVNNADISPMATDLEATFLPSPEKGIQQDKTRNTLTEEEYWRSFLPHLPLVTEAEYYNLFTLLDKLYLFERELKPGPSTDGDQIQANSPSPSHTLFTRRLFELVAYLKVHELISVFLLLSSSNTSQITKQPEPDTTASPKRSYNSIFHITLLLCAFCLFVSTLCSMNWSEFRHPISDDRSHNAETSTEERDSFSTEASEEIGTNHPDFLVPKIVGLGQDFSTCVEESEADKVISSRSSVESGNEMELSGEKGSLEVEAEEMNENTLYPARPDESTQSTESSETEKIDIFPISTSSLPDLPALPEPITQKSNPPPAKHLKLPSHTGHTGKGILSRSTGEGKGKNWFLSLTSREKLDASKKTDRPKVEVRTRKRDKEKEKERREKRDRERFPEREKTIEKYRSKEKKREKEDNEQRKKKEKEKGKSKDRSSNKPKTKGKGKEKEREREKEAEFKSKGKIKVSTVSSTTPKSSFTPPLPTTPPPPLPLLSISVAMEETTYEENRYITKTRAATSLTTTEDEWGNQERGKGRDCSSTEEYWKNDKDEEKQTRSFFLPPSESLNSDRDSERALSGTEDLARNLVNKPPITVTQSKSSINRWNEATWSETWTDTSHSESIHVDPEKFRLSCQSESVEATPNLEHLGCYSGILGSPSKNWFELSLSNLRILEQFYFCDPIPLSFLIDAFLESTISCEECESPHPYPSGVRVASQIYIPGAEYLVITFDVQSRISDASFLMFSKHSSGQNDLGFWSGTFPVQPLVVPGETFVWSFFSNDESQV